MTNPAESARAEVCDGTINGYFLRHGTEGLRVLADKAGTKLSYLIQLNYVTTKRPSLSVATRLVEASDGEITMEGLANPKKRLVKPQERRAKPATADG